MKVLKECFVMIAILCIVVFVASCDKTEGSVSFSGKVEVTPSVARIGDDVTFCIGKLFSVGGVTTSYDNSTTINGKEVVKSVVYYIDGNEINESSDKGNGYTLKYKVSGLSVGSHTVTAHCNSNFKDIEIVEAISSGTLTIEE